MLDTYIRYNEKKPSDTFFQDGGRSWTILQEGRLYDPPGNQLPPDLPTLWNRQQAAPLELHYRLRDINFQRKLEAQQAEWMRQAAEAQAKTEALYQQQIAAHRSAEEQALMSQTLEESLAAQMLAQSANHPQSTMPAWMREARQSQYDALAALVPAQAPKPTSNSLGVVKPILAGPLPTAPTPNLGEIPNLQGVESSPMVVGPPMVGATPGVRSFEPIDFNSI